MLVSTRPQILLVEDDPDLREALFERLASEGWAVDQAGDGAEAMRRIDAVAYSLVVLDFWLPKFNGGQVQAYLHALGDPPPVVLMSAIPQGAASPTRCTSEAYLIKPFSPEVLVKTCRALLAVPRGMRRTGRSGEYTRTDLAPHGVVQGRRDGTNRR